MPTISIFYGIHIKMYWDDHAPPHFHATYNEHKVTVDIQSLEVMAGKMPHRALALILEWAHQHRQELLQDWDLCLQKQQPHKIPPLS